jgi:hypothetical protein
MTKLDISDEELIRLWHDSRSSITLAVELGTTTNILDAQWRRLKKQNLLPSIKRPAASNNQRDHHSDIHDNQPPLFFEDRLLDKLIEVHGKPEEKK